MINFFSSYLDKQKNNETVSIPLYSKKAWKRFARTSCVKYDKYHDINMLGTYVLNAIQEIPTCKIRNVRFVYIEEQPFRAWARAHYLNPKIFETQVRYASSLSDSTADLLWQALSISNAYQLGGLLVQDPAATTPSVTQYDASIISELATSLLFNLTNFATISVYPYLVPLATVPSIQNVFRKDMTAFNDGGKRFFVPQFTPLREQNVMPGEEWCDNGIMYFLPIRLTPISHKSTVDLQIFNTNADFAISVESREVQLTNLLRTLCPSFVLADTHIYPLSTLVNDMLSMSSQSDKDQ